MRVCASVFLCARTRVYKDSTKRCCWTPLETLLNQNAFSRRGAVQTIGYFHWFRVAFINCPPGRHAMHFVRLRLQCLISRARRHRKSRFRPPLDSGFARNQAVCCRMRHVYRSWRFINYAFTCRAHREQYKIDSTRLPLVPRRSTTSLARVSWALLYRNGFRSCASRSDQIAGRRKTLKNIFPPRFRERSDCSLDESTSGF